MNPGTEQNAAGRQRAVGAVSRSRADVAGARAPAAGRRRGRDRRVGQPPRSAGAVGALRASCASAFHLYVPAGMVDVARRLCEDNQIHVTEIWSYHIVGDRGALHAGASQPRSRAALARRARGRAPAAAPPRDEARGRRGEAAGAAAQSRASETGAARQKAAIAERRSEDSVCLPQILARQARLRALLPGRADRPPRQGAGRASSTGFGRRPTSRSAASRSIDDVRRALEAQNPDVAFDWAADRRHADAAARSRALAGAAPRGARRRAGSVGVEDDEPASRRRRRRRTSRSPEPQRPAQTR